MTCTICGNPRGSEMAGGFMTRWYCPSCGDYFLPQPTLEGGASDDDPANFKLSSYARLTSQATSRPTELSAEIINQVRSTPEKSLEEKTVLVLEHFERRSQYFGCPVTTDVQTDFPLFQARNPEEARALLNLQRTREFIEVAKKIDGQLIDQLTAEGISALERMRRASRKQDKAFVAMWFTEEMDAAYTEHVKPAVEAAGFVPVRIDLVEHNEQIVGRIMAEIRQSRFVICDFCGHRNGVYFEAGFAKGLGLDVVWMCRKDEIAKAHFDTNHFNHLLWTDVSELKSKLLGRILATIGPGPHYQGIPQSQLRL